MNNKLIHSIELLLDVIDNPKNNIPLSTSETTDITSARKIYSTATRLEREKAREKTPIHLSVMVENNPGRWEYKTACGLSFEKIERQTIIRSEATCVKCKAAKLGPNTIYTVDGTKSVKTVEG